MISCSGRLHAVQAPVIPIIAGLIRAHPGTISLGQGVVSYGPPPEAIDRIGEFLRDLENHKYKPVQGIPLLVDALRNKLAEENGINLAAEQIFVTAGANLAFANALLAIADPGDEIILQTPYYFNHEMAVTMASCRPVLVSTDANLQLQPDAIAQAITPRTKAIVTVSPNNPTGAVYSEAALRQVNQLCRERGIYHIHDEAYEYFTYDQVRHFSPGSIEGASGHTFSLYSLSKAYGFASWRIGYMAVPAHLVQAVNKIQDTLLICAPVISQFAAVGALAAGKKYCLQKREEIENVRSIVQEHLASLADIAEIPPAAGAFYFLMRLRSSMESLHLVERLVAEHQIAAIPGTAFGLMNSCSLRIAYGALRKESASEAMHRLVTGLRAIIS